MEAEIERAISENELFLLFWSQHAKESEWVDWEWRTALRLKGLAGIQPRPLDPVFLAEPPQELQSLHFGDALMLARHAFGTETKSI